MKQAQTQITQLTEAAVELQAKVTQTQQAVQQQNTTVDKLATTLTTEQQRLPADASTRAEYLTRVQKLQDQLAADQQMWTALERNARLPNRRFLWPKIDWRQQLRKSHKVISGWQGRKPIWPHSSLTRSHR
ncbi:hypothetical protein L3X07_01570 [Levilactobacillus brevis]|nr:hypothetical protein [Levilactobacillus brevis]